MENSRNNQSQTGQRGSKGQFENLSGEKFNKALPTEKVQYTVSSIHNLGFSFKPGKEQTFINEITEHIKQNPKISRIDLLKQAYSRIDENMIDELELEENTGSSKQ